MVGHWFFFFFFFVGLWLFGCMGIFWTCDFGHGIFFFFFFFVCYGKFLIMWFWSWKIFWTCDLRHGNFGHVILVMGIFWAYDFGHENFWPCGNFKWDKFRIHLMRSYSTNLNLSWLALMEFALMRQSWMPLVWKWMHDFFWNHEILVFYEKMMMVVPFFFFFLKWMRHGQMPLVCRWMHDFLKTLIFEEKMISFFQNGWSMAECR